MRLTEVRTEAEEQSAILDKCLSEVKKAIAIGIKKEDSTKIVNYYSDKFDNTVRDLNGLQTNLNSHLEAWKSVDIKSREQKMRVLVTHALLRLSEKSGLETGALLIGTMVGLGFVYMFFFYQAAAGQYVHTYWTLEDLFIQAIHVAWLVVPIIFAFEIIFRILLRGYENEKELRSSLFKIVIRRPTSLLVTILIVLLLCASFVSYFSGKGKFDRFTDIVNSESEWELATVTDGTVLRNVYMVGTTATTAVFLKQADKNGAFFSETPAYCQIWERFFDSFLFTDYKGNEQSSGNDVSIFCYTSKIYNILKGYLNRLFNQSDNSQESAKNGEKYRVLVMDRGLVVCHAKGTICENLPKLENKIENKLSDQFTNLDNKLEDGLKQAQNEAGEIGKKIGTVEERLNTRMDDIETHMHRHYFKMTTQLRELTTQEKTKKSNKAEQVDKAE